MLFWGFEDYGVLTIWGLCCFEDLRIMVSWGFEDYGTMKIWGLWCLRIWGIWCSEDLRIMVFWGFEDYVVLRIWGLWWCEGLRIMVFWGFEDCGFLRKFLELEWEWCPKNLILFRQAIGEKVRGKLYHYHNTKQFIECFHKSFGNRKSCSLFHGLYYIPIHTKIFVGRWLYWKILL